MRILILSDRIPPENVGGAEKVAWTFARGLQGQGHDVHAIAATRGAYFEAVREGIPTYHLHVQYPARFNAYFSLYNPQVAALLKRLYTQIKPDVIGAFNIHSDLTNYSLWLAHRLKIPTALMLQDVMAFSYTKLTHYIDPTNTEANPPTNYQLPHWHNLKTMRLRYNPLRNLVIRHIVNRCVDVRIAGSYALRQALHANGLTDFRVIHASVNPEDFKTSSESIEALQQRLGLTDKKVILFAGRLTHDKGSVQLLQALSQIVTDIPNVRLLMLTRATLEQQGLTAPEYQHLLDHICIGGWMQGEALAAAYQLADVVVVPSICLDVFPTINLEAMAASKPVIATCFGGSPEAILDGETGYIVNPFDTVTFADRLKRLLTDENLARRMGLAARQRLDAQFSLDRQVQLIESAYQDAIR